MDILYDFRKYDTPRFGVFKVHTGEYGINPTGWIDKDVKMKIIGEAGDNFIEYLKEGGHGEWIGTVVTQKKYILPIGPHKSRLVRWIDGQLSIFD